MGAHFLTPLRTNPARPEIRPAHGIERQLNSSEHLYLKSSVDLQGAIQHPDRVPSCRAPGEPARSSSLESLTDRCPDCRVTLPGDLERSELLEPEALAVPIPQPRSDNLRFCPGLRELRPCWGRRLISAMKVRT